MLKIIWEDYTKKAPHMSRRWAMSDRGWAAIQRAPDLFDTCGNYLDYSGTNEQGQDGKRISCYAGISSTDCSGNKHWLRLGSTWVATIAEAKQWIEATVTAHEATLAAKEAN